MLARTPVLVDAPGEGPSRGGWVRPRQRSVGLLDFDVEHSTTCSQCGSTIDGPCEDYSGLVLAGRYQLRRLLGSGATALVYEGVDRKTARPVAVKILHAAVRAKVGSLFQQEAQLAARVRSPHLIQASDFGDDQGRPFIIFDLLPGRPLAALIQVSLLPWLDICKIGLHVLDALAALHREGVVHRDVKPDNIFVSNTVGAALHATLLDLGFAAVVTAEPTRAVFGTAGYIAPEVFGGLPVDPRNDLYSLGAVLYVALTGQPVPDYRTFGQIVLPSPQVFRPDVPDGVATVVLRALSDLDARYSSAEEMAAAIARAIRDAGGAAKPPPAPPPPRRLPLPVGRRAPGRALVAVAAFACGALALQGGVVEEVAVVGPSSLVASPTLVAPAAAHDVPPPPTPTATLPAALATLEAARPALRACVESSSSLVIDVACERGEGRFSRVDVIGDDETATCARQVLDALRFEPAAAPQAFIQEFGP